MTAHSGFPGSLGIRRARPEVKCRAGNPIPNGEVGPIGQSAEVGRAGEPGGEVLSGRRAALTGARPALWLAALLSIPATMRPLPARAQSVDGQPAARPIADITELSLEDILNGSQLDEAVSLSTKTAQRAAQTPAVVTVISSAEIRARGYSNLAEALRAVPGFYDVYDLVSHNVGVRG